MNANGSSKKHTFYSWIIVFCFFSGIIFFFIKREWLIFRFNFGCKNNSDYLCSQNISLRKKIKLYFWRGENFFSEEQEIVWLSDKAENLKHLINNWFSFLHQERLLDKKVSIENVLIDWSGQHAYLSMDQMFFDREWSIFQKCNLVEGMLKTIKNAESSVKYVSFLIKNQPMEDDHLDFSEGWPIEGFLRDYQNT